MEFHFESPAVFVKDIDISRKFYETTLGQDILMDNGPHMAFKSGFSVWQVDHAYEMIFDCQPGAVKDTDRKSFELYFETVELAEAWQRLQDAGVKPLHSIREHPWGQLGFRVYDPDDHIVEVSEPIWYMVRRFLNEGQSVPEIAERTSIPEAVVHEIIKGMASAGG